jgi:hypothetical protein
MGTENYLRVVGEDDLPDRFTSNRRRGMPTTVEEAILRLGGPRILNLLAGQTISAERLEAEALGRKRVADSTESEHLRQVATLEAEAWKALAVHVAEEGPFRIRQLAVAEVPEGSFVEVRLEDDEAHRGFWLKEPDRVKCLNEEIHPVRASALTRLWIFDKDTLLDELPVDSRVVVHDGGVFLGTVVGKGRTHVQVLLLDGSTKWFDPEIVERQEAP